MWYQSVNWLTSLLKLDKYRDISCSGWCIFLKYFGHIPEMFLHYFQMLKIFLYVCQSVTLLTSLQKLGQYRDISWFGGDIFLKFFWGIPGMFVHTLPIITIFFYVCESVSWLISLLKINKYRDFSSSGLDIFLTF